MIITSDMHIEQFLKYWEYKLPDVTDLPELLPSNMRYWTKIKSKDKRKKPHPIMDALCGFYTNHSFDFAISKNTWCVQFKDADGNTINLVPRAMLKMWLRYCAYMRGHPMPDSNVCLKVLKYIILNKEKFVKCFHNRMYYYSSGTLFDNLCKQSLKPWLADHPDSGERALRKLLDVDS